jgi:hypothetical protein
VIDESNDRKRFGGKRLLVAAGYVASLAAVAALFAGVTYGLFSATTSNSPDGFTAGTVTQSNALTGACSVSNMLPDGSTSACTLKVTYTGSRDGYLGLDVLIQTQAGSGGHALYDPGDAAHDLQVSVTSSSPSVTYDVPVTSTPCPGTAPSGSTCYELDRELVSPAPLANGGQVTFTTTLSLPTTSTTGYQGGAAQIVLTAHAAQSDNNGSTGGCTAGRTCNGVSWS